MTLLHPFLVSESWSLESEISSLNNSWYRIRIVERGSKHTDERYARHAGEGLMLEGPGGDDCAVVSVLAHAQNQTQRGEKKSYALQLAAGSCFG